MNLTAKTQRTPRKNAWRPWRLGGSSFKEYMMWIVSYDIPNDKRRRRVAKVLEGYGRRAQYSVFECDIDKDKCEKLEKLLKREIDPTEDDIRFYPMNRADLERVVILGNGTLYQSRPFDIW
jgi:CRISPR-associated protein Cas2